MPSQQVHILDLRIAELQKAIAEQFAAVAAVSDNPVASAFAIRKLRVLQDSLAISQRSHDDVSELAKRQKQRGLVP